jgi:hypothetical protein
MAPRTRVQNAQELTEVVNQALDAVEDFRAEIEYDDAYMSDSSILVEPVSHGLCELLAAIDDGEYAPGQGTWMAFLETIRDMDHRAVPFWPKLRLILETHEKGYLTSDEAAGA